LSQPFKQVRKLKIYLNFRDNPIPVGDLIHVDGVNHFQYDPSFRGRNLHISPYHLKNDSATQTMQQASFDGIFGVFYDSLPDGWGRLLVDRKLQGLGFNPQMLTALDRLSLVGEYGLGALTYKPAYRDKSQKHSGLVILDLLSSEAMAILEGKASDCLSQLQALNGGSGGARPKVLIGVNDGKSKIIKGVGRLKKGFEHWIVKFQNSGDGDDAGAIEYVYSIMARNSGVEMTDTHLFSAENSRGFFATRRFDRSRNARLHMHSACGLLHSSFRVPTLDYDVLLKVTSQLTKDFRQTEKVFRLAVFNVLACNQDDHSKNFAFLMDEEGTWRFAPAYDLTFLENPFGERSTTVMGKGKNIRDDDLVKLAQLAELKQKAAKEIIEQTKEALRQWRSLAKKYGVSKLKRDLIAKKICP